MENDLVIYQSLVPSIDEFNARYKATVIKPLRIMCNILRGNVSVLLEVKYTETKRPIGILFCDKLDRNDFFIGENGQCETVYLTPYIITKLMSECIDSPCFITFERKEKKKEVTLGANYYFHPTIVKMTPAEIERFRTDGIKDIQHYFEEGFETMKLSPTVSYDIKKEEPIESGNNYGFYS